MYLAQAFQLLSIGRNDAAVLEVTLAHVLVVFGKFRFQHELGVPVAVLTDVAVCLQELNVGQDVFDVTGAEGFVGLHSQAENGVEGVFAKHAELLGKCLAERCHGGFVCLASGREKEVSHHGRILARFPDQNIR